MLACMCAGLSSIRKTNTNCYAQVRVKAMVRRPVPTLKDPLDGSCASYHMLTVRRYRFMKKKKNGNNSVVEKTYLMTP